MKSMQQPFSLGQSLLMITLLLLSVAPSYASLAIKHWQTNEGMQVYFVAARQLPMVDIQLVFAAGSARDGDQPGISMLTSQLLDDGADGLDADSIASRFEDLGAQFSTSSHTDMSVISLRSLSMPDLLNPAIKTLRRILHKPEFPAKSLARERRQQLIAIQAEKESPQAIAHRAFMKGLYGQHPYGHSPLGNAESLAAIDRQAIRGHYQKFYSAGNAVLALVGDIDEKKARQIAATFSSALPVGPHAPALPKISPLLSSQVINIDFPSSQSHLLIGQPGLRRNDPDYFPLYVGNHILGGSGLVSRISEEIREKNGLAYSAYSYFSAMEAAGPFTMGLQTRNDQLQQAESLLMKTLRQFLQQGPREKELLASKQNITGGFPLRLSSNRKIVANLAMIGFYQLPLDYLDRFNDRVEAVTREQIQQAFRKRIDPDHLVFIHVGKQTDAPPQH